jgi:hypothetical protein
LIKQLSQTPFAEISDIIKKYIHASNAEEQRQHLNKIIQSDLIDEDQKEAAIKNFKAASSKPLEIEDTLKLLEARHNKYKEINALIESIKKPSLPLIFSNINHEANAGYKRTGPSLEDNSLAKKFKK